MTHFPRLCCVISCVCLQALFLGAVCVAAQEIDTSHRLKLPAAQQAELRRSDDLNSQLLALYRQGEYSQAVKLAEQGLEIRERILGAEHFETGTFVNNLAAMYSELGNYVAAEKLYLRAVRIDERYAGPDHPKTALRISNLALIYLRQAKFEPARVLLERALAINEKSLGPDHPDTAVVLHNLGGAYKDQQDYVQAEQLFQRALRIRETALGPDDQSTASTLGNLAAVYVSLGRYPAAEPLLQRSVRISEKTLGADHPQTAIQLSHLARLYEVQGNFLKAHELNLRVLRIVEQKLGPDHPVTATALSNLAKLYRLQDDLDELEKVHKRILAIREGQLGAEHPDTSLSLNDLGIVYARTRRYAEAESVLKRAVAINEKILGLHHPQTATALGNLASVYMDQGKYAAAVPLAERGVRIKESSFASSHPDVAYSLVRLACLQEAIGKTSDAAGAFDRARRSTAQHTSDVLPALSEQQQVQFTQMNYVDHFSRALSLALRHSGDDRLVRTSAAWVINGKAIRQEALAARNLLTRDIKDTARAQDVKKLLDVRKKLASLAMMTVPPEQLEKRDQVLNSLIAEEQQLSTQLAPANSAVAGVRRDWIEHHQLRDAIPDSTVFIDIMSFHPFQFEAVDDNLTWLPARYVAWVSHPSGGPQSAIVDLGDAAEIDELVRQTRTHIQNAGGSSGQVAIEGDELATATIMTELRRLADRIWKPLEIHAASATQIVLSPDGALWLAPWSSLPVGKDQDQFLLETHSIRYAISGREFLLRPAKTTTTVPVILANPQFDLNLSQKQKSIEQVFDELPLADETTLRGFSAKEVLPKAVPLPNTAIEALVIKPNLEKLAGREATVYQQNFALERIAKALVRPRIAAFATHGFFLQTQESQSRGLSEVIGSEAESVTLDTNGKPVENPLLRCGLLFSGCNNRDATVGDDDGILTGLEIVSIDFRGTELVVLSACETGIGDVHHGEGVAGLRQAFQLAGAKAVVSTLWQVPDRDSALLMKSFFEQLADGATTADALRNAQIERIETRRQRYGAAHPFFWAAFTLTGR